MLPVKPDPVAVADPAICTPLSLQLNVSEHVDAVFDVYWGLQLEELPPSFPELSCWGVIVGQPVSEPEAVVTDVTVVWPEHSPPLPPLELLLQATEHATMKAVAKNIFIRVSLSQVAPGGTRGAGVPRQVACRGGALAPRAITSRLRVFP
jgi:hypothetical protein